MERQRRSKWQRHDRDDHDETDGAWSGRTLWGDDHDNDDDDGEGGRDRRSHDSLVDHAKSGGMVGSLLFWLAIWAFTSFNPTLFAIFLGVAILQGWSWNKAEGFHKRRKRRRRERERDQPIGAAPPLDGSVPAR
ncbi:MAG: hypothetical protein MUF14_07095, partial [Hyphomonadaceae bacterium]|nr:hypothetical protein [Hyphomonadaceae bacterium]